MLTQSLDIINNTIILPNDFEDDFEYTTVKPSFKVDYFASSGTTVDCTIIINSDHNLEIVEVTEIPSDAVLNLGVYFKLPNLDTNIELSQLKSDLRALDLGYESDANKTSDAKKIYKKTRLELEDSIFTIEERSKKCFNSKLHQAKRFALSILEENTHQYIIRYDTTDYETKLVNISVFNSVSQIIHSDLTDSELGHLINIVSQSKNDQIQMVTTFKKHDSGPSYNDIVVRLSDLQWF